MFVVGIFSECSTMKAEPESIVDLKLAAPGALEFITSLNEHYLEEEGDVEPPSMPYKQ